MGDQVRPEGSTEVMLVTAIAGAVITVVRGYGATTKATLADNMVLTILGNAALEASRAGGNRKWRERAGFAVTLYLCGI